ncbi:Lrp/AsnC family transcriptional regulator [Nonomuraea sp. NPDC050310]|uniref:Lrp/AsnC family transcriptional regulator n=1 Tax=unclassified Nonomuraea TaxID=2593643 RepID=UPI0033FC9970
MEDLDDIDHRLIRLLREDGRRTFSEMAGVIGLSVAAVKRRVDRMRELGVITGFTARIDYAKLGWGIQAFTEMRYSGSTPVGEIVRTTTGFPEVEEVFTIAGDPDALIHVRARDLDHLQQVIDNLRRAGNVTGTKTLMVLGSWSRETLPRRDQARESDSRWSEPPRSGTNR